MKKRMEQDGIGRRRAKKHNRGRYRGGYIEKGGLGSRRTKEEGGRVW